MVFFHPVFKHDVDQPVHVKNKLSPNAKKRRVKKQPFTFTYSPSGPITLELSSAKVTINWGDASSEKVKGNKSVTHAYVIPDNVTVSIKGTAKSIKFTTPGYVAVTSWGTLGFTSFANMFNTVTVTGLPPTIPATVRDMSGMFAKSSFLNGDISKWNVSKVTNMSAMFAESPFNQDISEWDVGNVTNMTAMFFKSSFTGSIYKWNVSNVTKMTGMFAKSPFNGDISIWNVSKVTDMSAMFNDATLFNKIERHFLAKLPGSEEAIITDTKKVIHTLNSLCMEMDNRYTLLKEAEVRNLKEYNTKFVARKLNPEKGHYFMPYIVLVIDELADLMMTAGKEIEAPIARLAQLARAIGIHLVVATQRPSVNVITGVIKANFPARLSFRVTSKIDSRTILDAGGADQLIGMGDMLLSVGSEMTRIQCAFLDTPEVEAVCDWIGGQKGYSSAYLLPEYVGEDGEGSGMDFDLSDRDPLFDEAARLIVLHQQGSTSLIQRKLKLGYNRAGRIVDQLEAAGVVGSFEGSKAREVLIQDEVSLERLLSSL